MDAKLNPSSPAEVPVSNRSEPSTSSDSVTSTRDLVLLWCLWLLGSWVLGAEDGWSTASRWMVFSCLTGVMVMWPVLRLSQNMGQAVSAGLLLWDWLCLNMVLQAVIWPLCVTSGWTSQQALWLVAALAAWSLLSGAALLAAGCWTSVLGRVAGTLLCLLLVLGEPLLMACLACAHVGSVWSMWISPIDTFLLLTGDPMSVNGAHIIGVAVAAVLGWLVVSVSRLASAAERFPAVQRVGRRRRHVPCRRGSVSRWSL